MAAEYRCKCCNTTLVSFEDLEGQAGPAFWDSPGFVCINCDYIIHEDAIVRGIKYDPNFDIEEITMPRFKKATDREMSFGTQFRGELQVPGFLLTQKFGDPLPPVDDKITGEFIFVDESGNVATIYDWYNKSKSVWTATQPFTFHVGAKSEKVAVSFANWLRKQLGF